MVTVGALSSEAVRAQPGIFAGFKKKRLILDGFLHALEAYFSGAAETCTVEPLWPKLIAFVVQPEDPPERQKTARAELETFELTCSKLRLSPSACIGCENNPRG